MSDDVRFMGNPDVQFVLPQCTFTLSCTSRFGLTPLFFRSSSLVSSGSRYRCIERPSRDASLFGRAPGVTASCRKQVFPIFVSFPFPDLFVIIDSFLDYPHTDYRGEPSSFFPPTPGPSFAQPTPFVQPAPFIQPTPVNHSVPTIPPTSVAGSSSEDPTPVAGPLPIQAPPLVEFPIHMETPASFKMDGMGTGPMVQASSMPSSSPGKW